MLVGVDEEPQQRGPPSRLVGLEDVELFGRGEVVSLELDVEVEGRVVDVWRRMLGGGRAVDRGHRQQAILEGALQDSRSRGATRSKSTAPTAFGPSARMHSSGRSHKCSASTGSLRQGPPSARKGVAEEAGGVLVGELGHVGGGQAGEALGQQGLGTTAASISNKPVALPVSLIIGPDVNRWSEVRILPCLSSASPMCVPPFVIQNLRDCYSLRNTRISLRKTAWAQSGEPI